MNPVQFLVSELDRRWVEVPLRRVVPALQVKLDVVDPHHAGDEALSTRLADRVLPVDRDQSHKPRQLVLE